MTGAVVVLVAAAFTLHGATGLVNAIRRASEVIEGSCDVLDDTCTGCGSQERFHWSDCNCIPEASITSDDYEAAVAEALILANGRARDDLAARRNR